MAPSEQSRLEQIELRLNELRGDYHNAQDAAERAAREKHRVEKLMARLYEERELLAQGQLELRAG